MHGRTAKRKELPIKAGRLKAGRLKAGRLSMRIDETSKIKLERAAAYASESVSDYVVTRALKAAEDDISAHENIALDPPQWDAFIEALKNPPKPNEKLLRLLRTHDEKIVSR